MVWFSLVWFFFWCSIVVYALIIYWSRESLIKSQNFIVSNIRQKTWNLLSSRTLIENSYNFDQSSASDFSPLINQIFCTVFKRSIKRLIILSHHVNIRNRSYQLSYGVPIGDASIINMMLLYMIAALLSTDAGITFFGQNFSKFLFSKKIRFRGFSGSLITNMTLIF